MKKLALMGLSLGALVCAQDTEKITMPFSNPSAPHKLNVDVMLGSVTVRGYEGRDVIVEFPTNENPQLRRRAPEPPPPGMHRIGGNRAMDVSESNNVVTVKTGFPLQIKGEIVIQTPMDTSVTVTTLTGKNVTIDNISGEIEANNMNGAVTINNASGAVVAHSMNGKVLVSLNRVPPDKMMSFSTMNGDVDVTLPADAKATFKMRDDNGDIWSDFDVKLEAQNPAQTTTEEKNKSGKVIRRVRVDGAQTGTVNGGGPELQFTTFNGRILIHKK